MEVQKVEDISYAAFMPDFYMPGIPVIFKNAAKGRKDRGLFRPEWLHNHSGDQQTEIALKTYTLPQLSVAFDQLGCKNFKDFVGGARSFKKKESTAKPMAETEYYQITRRNCKLDNSIHPQK
jgi:hypothetical protein